MPGTLILLLMAALPVGQATGPVGQATGASDNVSTLRQPRPDRHILASDDRAALVEGASLSADDRADDTRLYDVAFVDLLHGWAVGDNGTIWHTDDGGQRWTPQASGYRGSLTSISFVNSQVGWVAGGTAFPYLHDGAGVVLSTHDGGQTWQREPTLLPALRKIRFLNERHGWAAGCSSAMFPGGVFTSSDGGRSWQPPDGGGSAGWNGGDFLDPRGGVLVGDLGAVMAVRDGELVRARIDGVALQNIRAVQLLPPAYGWLVGDGGLVASTADRGRTWQPPLGPLPIGSDQFDFAAVAVRGSQSWIAGSPGSRVFHSSDAGRTWTAQTTGITTPITAITFADDVHGWAAGELGQILATRDGGRTWQRQHGAVNARAAVMAIVGSASDLPLELIAKLCKEQGHVGVAQIVGRTDVERRPREDAPMAVLAHQAMLAVGGCAAETAWQFPMRDAALKIPAAKIIEDWDHLHKGRGYDTLLAHFVRQIRTWRPDVIVVPQAGATPDSGLNSIVHRAVVAAAKLAADRAYLAETFQRAGCEPWAVTRVYAVAEIESAGKVAVTSDDWSPQLGRTYADAAMRARAFLQSDYHPSPAAIRAELVDGNAAPEVAVAPVSFQSGLGEVVNSVGLLSGLPAVGHRAIPLDIRSVNPLQGLAQKKQMLALLDRFARDPQASAALLAKNEDLTQGLDAATSAQLIFRIADRLRHASHWDIADKVLAVLIQRYPDDPLARCGLVWRLQYLATIENQSESQDAALSHVAGKSPSERAIAIGREIERDRPELFALPEVRYPLALAYRGQNPSQPSQRLYLLDRRGVQRDAWWSCGHGEAWLLDRKGPLPKPVISCPAVTDRPRLDGRLDDAIWQKARTIALTSLRADDADWPASVMLAHDAQYLYLAIRCRRAPGVRYEAANGLRPRDPDLSDNDRIDIFLDINRSYSTYYRLSIDHRGWASDAYSSDASWNPKWFVAAQTADGAWTAEAAIPLAELKATIVPGQTVWAIGIQRTVPGVGFQSWSAPASPTVIPEGFGWLMFE